MKNLTKISFIALTIALMLGNNCIAGLQSDEAPPEAAGSVPPKQPEDPSGTNTAPQQQPTTAEKVGREAARVVNQVEGAVKGFLGGFRKKR